MFRLLLPLLAAFLLLLGTKASGQVYVDYSSSNGYKVLQPTFGNAIHSPDKTVEDLIVTNGQNAYYYVHLVPVGSGPGSSSLPDHFVLAPNETRTFPGVTFYGGDSLAFQADGTFNHPEVAFYEAAEVIFQVLFQNDVPSDIGDAFLDLLGKSNNLQVHAGLLGTALSHGDPSGVADELLTIADSNEVRAFLKDNVKVQAFLTNNSKQLGPITGAQKLAFYKAAYGLAKFGIGGLVAAYQDAQFDVLD